MKSSQIADLASVFEREFHYVFYTICDLIFIVLTYKMVTWAMRPDRQHHLRWARPYAAACLMTGAYRFVMDVHHYSHYFKIGSTSIFGWCSLLLYVANFVYIYSIIALWQTLHNQPVQDRLPTWRHRGRRRTYRVRARASRAGPLR